MSTRRNYPNRTWLLLFALGCSGPNGDASEPPAIRVTSIPDENPTELARTYAPLVKHLETQLGMPVSYVPVTDYGAAVQALAAAKVDFAWLGGFTHVLARNMGAVEPLVMRDIDRRFRSVFIANTASGITSPNEFRNRTFAFGSKSSTSGHLMPRHYLQSQLSIDPDKDFDGLPVFSGAHDATVRMVESGRVQGGVVNLRVWSRMLAQGSVDATKVHVVWRTPEYVDYVWTVRKDVPVEVREKFAKALLSLDSNNQHHAEVLRHMGAQKYVRSQPGDFDSIEEVAVQLGMLKH